ncbi:hypothetical protein EV715DRAFT_268935 [Schizophyllum commune]
MGSLPPPCRADDAQQNLSGGDPSRQLMQAAQEHQLGDESSAARRSLISRIGASRIGITLAPIHELPVEVLSIAFDFYLLQDGFRTASESDRLQWFMQQVDQGPCVLLRVCSRWRGICRTGLSSYFMTLIMSISNLVVKHPTMSSLPTVDGPMVRACLRHYMDLFTGGLFVLPMVHGAHRPAIVPAVSIPGGPGLYKTDPEVEVSDSLLASYAQRCSELVMCDEGTKASLRSLMRFANMIIVLRPAQGRLTHLETLSIEFLDPSNIYDGFFNRGHGMAIARCRLFAHAPKLHRLRLWKKAIHVLDAILPRLALPWHQIDDLRCQYYKPRSCLAALLSFPSLTTVALLRFVSYGPPAAGAQVDYVEYPENHFKEDEYPRYPIKRKPIPWPGYRVRKPICLARLSRLSLFCQYGYVAGTEVGDHPMIASLRDYPGEILNLLRAPELQCLRIGFASDEAPGGLRPTTVLPTIISFLRRSECALVELYMFLQTQETDEDVLELFRTIPSLQKLTLCMPSDVRLSAEVLQALIVMPARTTLLPSLRYLTLITDSSPDPSLAEGDSLAEAVESRVNARERTDGLVDNLEIFRFACQATHQFVWCERTKERMRGWMKQGLRIGRVVVDMPTEWIDVRDEGHFIIDWQWLWIDTIDD